MTDPTTAHARPSGRSRVTNHRRMLNAGAVLAETYAIGDLIDETDATATYAAFDRVLGRDVAIKTGQPSRGFESLRREARMLASVVHPTLPRVYGYGKDCEVEYVVLEKVQGTTLQSYIELRLGRRGFSAAETIEILLGVAEGLAVIHAAGFTHGDLIPDNILMTAGARVVLRNISGASSLDRTPDAGTRFERARRNDLAALGALGARLGCDDELPMMGGPTINATGTPERLLRIVHGLLALLGASEAPDTSVIAASLRAIRVVARGLDRDRLRAVVADDDPLMRDLLRLVIETASPGADVHFANDGLEAIELVDRYQPDVLFLDLAMPTLNGLEACMYLRGTRGQDRLAICVISQFAESSRSVLAGLGVVDIFQKGTRTPEELTQELGDFLRRIRPNTVVPPPTPPDSTLVNGRYEIGRQLGQGAWGASTRRATPGSASASPSS